MELWIQLGFPAKQTCAASRLSPKRIDGLKGEVVVDIAAASTHSGVVTSNGQVFTWGSNKKGQLGRKEGFGTDQALHTPKRVDSLLPHHANPAVPTDATSVVATKIAVSCHHTCVVLQVAKDDRLPQGQVWQWGMGGYFPSQVLLRHHSRDETLRLLHQNVWLPRVQQYPISIVDISCAPLHSIGLCAVGNVYVWGHGPNPLAANGRNLVPLTDRATSIAAAKEHCAVVVASGDVYTWGCHEGRNWLPTPKRVANMKQAQAVVAGPHHHAVLVTPRRPMLDQSVGHDTLVDRCQHVLRQQVSLQTVVTLYAKADLLDMAALKIMCRQFVALNLDAVLEMTRNAEDWPIELTDEVSQQRQMIQRDVPRKIVALRAAAEIPVKKDVEKKLRSLQKRLDQLGQLELVVSPTDAQKAKLKRKPDLLRQILELNAQLPQPNAVARGSTAMRPAFAAKSIAGGKESNLKQSTQLLPLPFEQDKRCTVPTPAVPQSKPARMDESTTTTLELSRPVATLEETKPTHQRKSRAKFVPLNSFLDAQAAKPMTPSAVPHARSGRSPSPMMSWAAPPSQPPPMKLPPRASASPASGPMASGGNASATGAFSLESFIKPCRRSKKATNDKAQPHTPWHQAVATTSTHSLTAIQAAEVVQVKHTWNLKKNQWGLCHIENVNLMDIQSIELDEKHHVDALVAQDMEFARKLQAEEYAHVRRHGGASQHKPRSKRRGTTSVRAA
ncbi:hypothetical protein DYB30_001199 [Aphanomyces astaci]|uniref:Uncharacterized protein n=1 Tax=Aphanomyces astaci TaxID=112090 RepID=A0A397E7S3_APHAT|nr:hypothetical protein DYB30_001199 [Aphanomyces astaci]